MVIDAGLMDELSAIAVEIEAIKYKLIQDYLVIGLPMMECNPGAVSEVWSLLQTYSYEIRYQVYEEWFTRLVDYQG